MNRFNTTRTALFASIALLLGSPLVGSHGFSQSTPAETQEAKVTFYSSHVTLTGGLPGRQPGAFKGRLFMEDKQLAFMEPGHFVTFVLPSGPHILSATTWLAKHSDSGAHITMNLGAGQHYFIETMTLNNWLGAVRFDIKEVSCQDAQKNNAHNKPLEPTHLRPDGVPPFIADTVFPACP
jgi:hypothetical protein